MRNLLEISRYNLWIAGLYLFLFPLFFIFTPDTLRYDSSSGHLGSSLSIIAVAFLVGYVLNAFFNFRKITWQQANFSKIVLTSVYAIAFAVPEEILFRGIVQGVLLQFVDSAFLIILISSAIFGLAHLPNGARGFHSKDWNWNFAFVVFLAGLPLSLIFAITHSLLIPTLLHAFLLIFFKLFTRE